MTPLGYAKPDQSRQQAYLRTHNFNPMFVYLKTRDTVGFTNLYNVSSQLSVNLRRRLMCRSIYMQIYRFTRACRSMIDLGNKINARILFLHWQSDTKLSLGDPAWFVLKQGREIRDTSRLKVTCNVNIWSFSYMVQRAPTLMYVSGKRKTSSLTRCSCEVNITRVKLLLKI